MFGAQRGSRPVSESPYQKMHIKRIKRIFRNVFQKPSFQKRILIVELGFIASFIFIPKVCFRNITTFPGLLPTGKIHAGNRPL